MIPGPKLPTLTLPSIRSIPTIPFVGSAAASGTTYIGEQFGNVPDLNVVLHIKTVKKALLEQIYALIEVELPDPVRPIPYAARAAQLTNELAEVAAFLAEIVAGITAEVNAAIDFANERIGEVNQAKSEIESTAAGARSPLQQLMLQRYDRYEGELAAQVGRLQSTLESL